MSSRLGRILVIFGETAPIDFDGDVASDIGVYRNGIWYFLRSTDGMLISVGWGATSGVVPVPADYDGDGKTDQAVFRNGLWFISSGLRQGWEDRPRSVPQRDLVHFSLVGWNIGGVGIGGFG